MLRSRAASMSSCAVGPASAAPRCWPVPSSCAMGSAPSKHGSSSPPPGACPYPIPTSSGNGCNDPQISNSPSRTALACYGQAESRATTGGIDVDEQPGFVVEGERVALGPLRMDLVPTYQRWENDLEVANANGRVIPFTLEAERERIAGRNGKPEPGSTDARIVGGLESPRPHRLVVVMSRSRSKVADMIR